MDTVDGGSEKNTSRGADGEERGGRFLGSSDGSGTTGTGSPEPPVRSDPEDTTVPTGVPEKVTPSRTVDLDQHDATADGDPAPTQISASSAVSAASGVTVLPSRPHRDRWSFFRRGASGAGSGHDHPTGASEPPAEGPQDVAVIRSADGSDLEVVHTPGPTFPEPPPPERTAPGRKDRAGAADSPSDGGSPADGVRVHRSIAGVHSAPAYSTTIDLRDPASGPVPSSRPAPQPQAARQPPPIVHPDDGTLDLLAAVERLRDLVDHLHLELTVPGTEEAGRERTALLGQLDDYLLPRLRRMDAPMLAVVGGSTGAGKSTLVNSLLRREVSRAGVLRPTTRSPVLVHHPQDSGAFLSQRILPGLARVTSEAPEPVQPIDPDAPRVTALRLVPHDGVPPGLALVDAPDIDSIVETNRDLAVQLLAAADLWLFVTTAARYADALPWDLLRQAADRGLAVAVVLDRVPPEALREIRLHLATRLRDRGLGNAPMFTIPETTTVAGLLPEPVVAPLLGWLTRLAHDSRSRRVVVSRTLQGALRSLPERVAVLAEVADAEAAAENALRSELDSAYAEARRGLSRQLSDGTLLRGEVLARWQEFVGTGQWIRGLESGVGRLRTRVGAALRGRPAPSIEPLGEALQTGLEAMIRASALSAVQQSVLRWRAHPAGAELLGRNPAPTRLSETFDTRVARMLRDWQGGVLDLVRTEGQGRRGAARVLSLGVNGTGIVLMLVAFAHTGGALGGTEVGVAAGAAVVGQRILEAVFGDQAVRTLAERSRRDLLRRVDGLLAEERGRLESLLDTVGDRAERGTALRDAVRAVEEAR